MNDLIFYFFSRVTNLLKQSDFLHFITGGLYHILSYVFDV